MHPRDPRDPAATPPRTSRARLANVGAVLAAMGVLAATVLAGLAGAENLPVDTEDTRYTPEAKLNAEDFGWRQIAGSIFDRSLAGDYEDVGVTPASVDFFTISFDIPKSDHGFAAGAGCEDPAVTDETELANCQRVPVIYEYARPPGRPSDPPEWREAHRASGPGYVGAIAWIPETGEAVAVGGTGCYPRREAIPSKTDEPAQADGCGPNAKKGGQTQRTAGRDESVAGDARAWRYANGAWSPIPDAELPPTMTGLTALAFSPRLTDCRETTTGVATRECGFAGGLGQLWAWKDGGFKAQAPELNYEATGYFEGDAPPAANQAPFRVRHIAIATRGSSAQIAAVTSGCCHESEHVGLDPQHNYPRAIDRNSNKWRIQPVVRPRGADAPAPRAAALPDSLYAVVYGGNGISGGSLSYLATPGSPDSGGPLGEPAAPLGEPASRVIAASDGLLLDRGSLSLDTSQPLNDWPELAPIRLTAADADAQGHARNVVQKIKIPQIAPAGAIDESDPDGILDWAVGEQTSTGQGLAYTTTLRPRGGDAPYPLSCPPDVSAQPVLPGEQTPDISPQCQADLGAGDWLASRHVFLLPSYPLNAMAYDGSVSWAAGDRGALLRRGDGEAAAGATGDANQAPHLGSGEPTRLSDRAAYDAFRPILSSEPGIVPPLGARPVKDFPAGQLLPAGTPSPEQDSVTDIAMSRDGTEGWAVGPSQDESPSRASSLYHFDGTRWTSCDPVGLQDVLEPDPACASIADVLTASDGRLRADFKLVTRVPTENGGTEDDFQAIAIVLVPRTSDTSPEHYEALEFKEGEWKRREDWTTQLAGLLTGPFELALAGPDDGWIVVNLNEGGVKLARLADGEWKACRYPHESQFEQLFKDHCLDKDLVLPIGKPHDAGFRKLGMHGVRLTSAGSRVYMYGTRRFVPPAGGGNAEGGSDKRFPFIMAVDTHEENPKWKRVYDPKGDLAGAPEKTCRSTDCANDYGVLNSLSIVRGPDGSETGWGFGHFGLEASAAHRNNDSTGVNGRTFYDQGDTPLLHWDPGAKKWAPVENPGPAAIQYLLPERTNSSLKGEGAGSGGPEVVALSGPGGTGGAVAIQRAGSAGSPRPMVWRNPDSGWWEAFPTPFTMFPGNSDALQQGRVTAVAPDNQGGMWLTAQSYAASGSWFYRFTQRVSQPVFSDTAHPIREQITSAAGGGDGSFWVTTDSGTVYRHDRLTGWDRVALKGWDAGGVVQSPAHAVAVGGNGEGIVVGKAGRIAEVGPRSVRLDPAAVVCSATRTDCPTTETLRAAAVAPDGAALAGGDARSLIYRPAGGTFRALGPPDLGKNVTITSITMPTPDQAWLATSTGDVMAGTRASGDWRWTRENLDRNGRLLSRTGQGTALAVRGVAVDKDGHGFAVGDKGLILERTSGEGWRRIPGYRVDMRTVTLGPGGRGALVGGDGGLLLTFTEGRFEVVRHAEYFDPLMASRFVSTIGGIVGVAVLPGSDPGDVEAWAVTHTPPIEADDSVRYPPPSGVLHYTSDPSDPLLSAGGARVKPLPDARKHESGEIRLAAFGKSECHHLIAEVCPEMIGSGLFNEVVLRRIRDTLSADKPDLAISTGDSNDVGGSRAKDTATIPTEPSAMHERWSDLVADPLRRAGVPLFGALGGQDLSHTRSCVGAPAHLCAGTRQIEQRVGLSLAWRQALADVATGPWGDGSVKSPSELSFEEVTSAARVDPGDNVGGAKARYALDVIRGEKKILRLVVLDTSLKEAGDQLAWLEDVLSNRGGLPAVVVSETPSYAYNNSAGAATDTLVDSAAFETVIVKNKVTAVISGRLGWNGLYRIVAPGLHTPCPGGEYEEDARTDASSLCQGSGGASGAGDSVAQALSDGLGAPVEPPSTALKTVSGLGNVPVAVAASAGGRFGPDGRGSGSGSQGFWHGYTNVRIIPGDQGPEVAVEQRPVFDWIGIRANEHTLTPGRRVKLTGYGREPLGIDQPAHYVDIEGPAITHSYDLVLADPDKPYLPKIDPTNEEPNHYVPVPLELAATIDETGLVQYSGRGNHPPVYALAILSVGDKAASWPIVLAPRRSFKALPPPRPQRVPAIPLPVVKTSAPATIPSPPVTNTPTPPNVKIPFPNLPSLPNLGIKGAQTTPPPPPAPPPPPVSPAASALQISPTPVGLNVAPAATVIPPPAPPIQPAPPGGARREARQRQAAAAKSEEGSADKQAGQEGSGGGESSQASTRLDQGRDLAFTAHEVREQPSTWSRGALYGGGLGIAAITLALGWNLMRPGPRRRQPEIPAPAWARSSRRRP